MQPVRETDGDIVGYTGATMRRAAAAIEPRAGMAASTSCRRRAMSTETSSGTQASRAP